ncbi:MAG TPA: hypothetical protein ENK11_10830 [Phycisphaerales bacterium]|nr:hypothetical protein [Phycisphaerales bacterium]
MRSLGLLLAVALLAPLGGCGEQPADTPPKVLLGDSVCDYCNMILSDERWATATIVQGPRGPEARLFDDFNCQVYYETEHPDLVILDRWSHDYTTREWLKTSGAFFLLAPELRSPMGSNAAAFATEAEAARAEMKGEVVPFDEAWRRLRPSDD